MNGYRHQSMKSNRCVTEAGVEVRARLLPQPEQLGFLDPSKTKLWE